MEHPNPPVVIGVTGGIAEVLACNPPELEVLILDFDHLDEYASTPTKQAVNALVDQGRYAEAKRALEDFEERWEA